MGKKKISTIFILYHLFVITMSSYSQGAITKELKWERSDTSYPITFQDTTQIIEWGIKQLTFSRVYTKNILIHEGGYFVIMVVGCSGLPCLEIYVFKYYNSRWVLKVNTKARIEEQIEINVDKESDNIIFKTKFGKLGEIPFNTLK